MLTRIMWPRVNNIIPLPYHATQSLLPSPLKPQLYIYPKKNTHTHGYKWNHRPPLDIISIIMEQRYISTTILESVELI